MTAMLTSWTLVFHVMTGPGITFEGGQYQSKLRCEQGAHNQLDHWKKTYRAPVYYRCHRTAWEDQ